MDSIIVTHASLLTSHFRRCVDALKHCFTKTKSDHFHLTVLSCKCRPKSRLGKRELLWQTRNGVAQGGLPVKRGIPKFRAEFIHIDGPDIERHTYAVGGAVDVCSQYTCVWVLMIINNAYDNILLLCWQNSRPTYNLVWHLQKLTRHTSISTSM